MVLVASADLVIRLHAKTARVAIACLVAAPSPLPALPTIRIWIVLGLFDHPRKDNAALLGQSPLRNYIDHRWRGESLRVTFP